MNAPRPPLVTGLLRTLPGARLIETHISWVILADGYAYKLKKPLDLGFLDFSSLEKRRFCCEEEVRLNRRLAPATYLGTVAITGTPDAPGIGGDGPVLEWAVWMRAFPADATLDHEPQVTEAQVDAIADRVASFHQDIPCAPADSRYGEPEQVRAPIRENFLQIRALRPPAGLLARLDALEAWSQEEGERLVPHFRARKAAGGVRECHGDLHLGNIAWVEAAPLIFDGIEFNPDLRYIDVTSEIGFLAMDLLHRGEDALAWRALNRYLEHTGDYAGLAALRYYMVYRAMVRAKVAAIRARQADADFAEALVYMELAARLSRPPSPALILMHGVSGSGKSVLAQALLQALGAIRLRSDVERKRLFGLRPLDGSHAIPGGIYGREAGERTLARLLALTEALLREGFRVIVDATFLAREWRTPFQALAASLRLPWCLVSPQVPETLLRERVRQRQAAGADASEADLAVLEAQLAGQVPLDADELRRALTPPANWALAPLLTQLDALLARPSP
ncbi:MAG: AAA family ATPase [Pseudomonadota bacterium]